VIELRKVTKSYYGAPVVEDISFTADSGAVCGLIGYNGAGKTTLLRVMGGVYKPDAGAVLLDGDPVFENAGKKAQVFMLTEDLYVLPQASLNHMRAYYAGYYNTWRDEVFSRLCAAFGLDREQKIAGFSKGMKKQAGVIIAFSAAPRYLLLDEVFDGLDLAMRRVMRKLLADYVAKTGAAVVVTSHNLRELEDGIDKIVMIQRRHLRYMGPVAEIQKRHGTLEEYFLSENPIDDSAFEGVFEGAV
jgi:ABC-2 type transport system ATP-binding protein